MSQVIEIAPSILSADFAHLADEIKAVELAGANLIHLDVMDGHFVPNITFGPAVIKALRPLTTLPFDVHLMIAPVFNFIEAFARAGSDIMSIHPESGPDVHRSLLHIKSFGKQAGIVINPGTNISVLNSLMDDLDQILVMTVNPGFGGQSFMNEQLKKIEHVRKMIDLSGRSIVLEVDGGIIPETAKLAIAAGATRLVAGTSVFAHGPENYKKNIAALLNLV
jgi:ribulose-phosphate 3-epimerase